MSSVGCAFCGATFRQRAKFVEGAEASICTDCAFRLMDRQEFSADAPACSFCKGKKHDRATSPTGKTICKGCLRSIRDEVYEDAPAKPKVVAVNASCTSCGKAASPESPLFGGIAFLCRDCGKSALERAERQPLSNDYPACSLCGMWTARTVALNEQLSARSCSVCARVAAEMKGPPAKSDWKKVECRCAFCGSKDSTRGYVAGPRLFICNRCVWRELDVPPNVHGPDAACGFCGRHRDEVPALTVSREDEDAIICRKCLELAADVVPPRTA